MQSDVLVDSDSDYYTRQAYFWQSGQKWAERPPMTSR